jgi:hypothetical protein
MNLSHAIFALALCASQNPGAQHNSAISPPASKAMRIYCTPNTVSFDGGIPQHSTNAIAFALTFAAPGAVIELAAGDYHSFDVGTGGTGNRAARTSGGNREQRIIVNGNGHVRIDCGSEGIKIAQMVPNAFITFQNLELRAGKSWAVQFLEGEGWVHEGYQFLDCDIVGKWDHELQKEDGASRGGLRASGLKDFKFAGLAARAEIRDLKLEHAFSLKNLRGEVLIENVSATRLGGAFVRVASDASESYSNEGSLMIRNCFAEECCLADGDDRRGAGVVTVEGRFDGRMLLQGDSFRTGALAAVAKVPLSRAASQRGILLDWGGTDGASAGRLTLIGNRLESPPGSPRPQIAIAGCAKLELRGANFLGVAGNGVALELEPIGRAGGSAPIGALLVDKSTSIQGAISWRGTEVSLDELFSRIPRLIE